MKNKHTFITQNTIFGLCIGVSFMLASYIFYKSGQQINLNPRFNNILMLLTIAGSFIGTRKYRDENLDGKLSYPKALGTCVYLTAIASVSYGIYIYTLYHIHPELQEEYLNMTKSILEEVYKNSPLLETMQTLLTSFMTAGMIAFSETFNKIFTGFIFSLFLAGILRRK
ncbi:MAG: DUF4199 domain-containing protein [Odoribacter sp.]|nr:DUF4199 domain-containing protein [Odoribacter sp.]